jgi:hypothetical protein
MSEKEGIFLTVGRHPKAYWIGWCIGIIGTYIGFFLGYALVKIFS